MQEMQVRSEGWAEDVIHGVVHSGLCYSHEEDIGVKEEYGVSAPMVV